MSALSLRTRVDLPSGVTALVRELVVTEVRALLDADRGIGLDLVAELVPDAIFLTGEMTEADGPVLREAFEARNRALYAAARQDRKVPSKLAAARNLHDFDRTCLALVEAGHVGIWEYPYRLYALLVAGV
jgi:hypothetical protein